MCVAFDPQWVVCTFAFEWSVLWNKVVWPEGVVVQLYNLLRSWYNRRVNQVWRETWSKVHPAPASELLCHQVICDAFLLQFSIHLFEAKDILLVYLVSVRDPKWILSTLSLSWSVATSPELPFVAKRIINKVFPIAHMSSFLSCLWSSYCLLGFHTEQRLHHKLGKCAKMHSSRPSA